MRDAENGYDKKERLVYRLRRACSNELAAATAYRGHKGSLASESEKAAIDRFEQDERAHRQALVRMLMQMESRPWRRREVLMWLVGQAVAISCYLTGRFLPMYFAGVLEQGNVREYIEVAQIAGDLDLTDVASQLLKIAVEEMEHEQFFRKAVAGHKLLPSISALFGWD